MSEWRSINIYKNQIETETAKAVLVKMPRNCKYMGWVFWHPRKLVRDGRNDAAVEISYTDRWAFNICKMSPKPPFVKLATKRIDIAEFEKMFEKIDANIESQHVNQTTTVDVKEAPELKVGDIVVPKDLLND